MNKKSFISIFNCKELQNDTIYLTFELQFHLIYDKNYDLNDEHFLECFLCISCTYHVCIYSK